MSFKLKNILIVGYLSFQISFAQQLMGSEVENLAWGELPKNACVQKSWLKLPVMVCRVDKSRIKKRSALLGNLATDDIETRELKIKKLAANIGSYAASIISEHDRKINDEQEYIAVLLVDTNACELKVNDRQKLLYSTCEKVAFTFDGIPVSNGVPASEVLFRVPVRKSNDGNSELIRETSLIKDFFDYKEYIKLSENAKIREAAHWGKLDLLKKIISSENVNQSLDEDGNYALYFSLIGNKDNYVETVKMLMSSGANINIENKIGERPIMLAAIVHSEEVVELLIKNGAKYCDLEHDTLWGFVLEKVKTDIFTSCNQHKSKGGR